MMKNIISTFACVTLLTILQSRHTLGDSIQSELLEKLNEKELMKAACSTTDSVGCPSGPYLSTCSSCFVEPSTQALTCNCLNSVGTVITSTFPNAFSCDGYVSNSNGQLSCIFPPSSSTNGYLSLCNGCSVNTRNMALNCLQCSTNVNVAGLSNAYSCSMGVQYNGALQCYGSNTARPTTPSPTNKPVPTTRPVPPTSRPTPAGANICTGVWNPLATPNGMELYPQDACKTFRTRDECFLQDYCCWNSRTKVCAPPPGVPECTLNRGQGSCNSFPKFCFWNRSTGRCQRLCPGNPSIECPSTT